MATVRYLVSDVEEAIAFYTQRLDFSLEMQAGSAFAIVSKADLRLGSPALKVQRLDQCRTGASQSRAAGTASPLK